MNKLRDCYSIVYDNCSYLFYQDVNVDEILFQYDISKDIDYFYDFVLNINNSILTEYSGQYYVLLKVKKYSFEHLLSIPYTDHIEKLKWFDLWVYNYDYLENIYFIIKGKYDFIDSSYDYYLGLFSTAIIYLKDSKTSTSNLYVTHKKFNYIDYFNPLNLKLDFFERDLGEYLKFIFFNGDYKKIDLRELIYEYKDFVHFDLVIARVLYPNYYFDLIIEIINDRESIDNISLFTSRICEFNLYLKEIIEIVQEFMIIKKIDYLF